MKTISFEQLSSTSEKFSKLFNNYITNFSSLEKYFDGDFHNIENIYKKSKSISLNVETRKLVATVLREQATIFNSGQKAFDNIDSLEDNKTFAIVTGQQTGIFLGPLYTIYKTITAIKLSNELNKRFTDKYFIPVFWMEGEDHDLNEANSISILNSENKLYKHQYLPSGKEGEGNIEAVGEIILDFLFNDYADTIFSSISKTEFSGKVQSIFSENYKDGKTFSTSFASLMNNLFPNSGLVFIYPNDKRLKKILTPVFRKELETYPYTSQLIIEQSAEIEKQFHAQIKPRSINLFFFHNSGRYALEPSTEKISLKGTRIQISNEEINSLLQNSPESFSPNVVLRPICQDSLLPTVAYVAGPSEIAYFAQLKPVYKYFGLTFPIIFPRASATIIESRIKKILEKFQLDVIDFFQQKEKVIRKFSENLTDNNLKEEFVKFEQSINLSFDTLVPSLQSIDSTLIGSVDTSKNKILYQLNSLKERSFTALQKKNQTSIQQIEKVIDILFPFENFQEREINILYFLNKYGLDAIEKISNELSITSFEHQLISL